MDPRQRLLKRIGDINNFDLPRPLVTLEEFFEGNDDFGSIGYNLPDQLSPQEFFTFFRKLRDHPEIMDVLVEVKDLEEPDSWPATDTIWFITSLSQAALARFFDERVRPDEWRAYPPNYPIESLHCPAGTKGIAAWYD